MPFFKINTLVINLPTLSYTVSKKDSVKCFELINGDFRIYPVLKGRFIIELSLVCDNIFFSQLDDILSACNEYDICFEYGGTLHNSFMMQKEYKAVCNHKKIWNINLSFIECRRRTDN